MTEIMMDGERIKAGDEVYSLHYGHGEVNVIDKGQYQVVVIFDDETRVSFTRDFKLHANDLTRDLYWQKPEIIPPPKSKKKIKVWDWVSYCTDGFPLIIHRAMTAQSAIDSGLNLKKIDGTEREVER